ncbi:MAG TPA: His-Xaa-Ser system radical SAM maturase HxsC [Myxococcaceae bacterium]|nr:His-Xaa-Ser system radical SAM maturase HxsC [Myxococcaceae bacterium]
MTALHARLPPWSGEPAVLRKGDPAASLPVLPEALSYLADGDVVRVVPQAGEIAVLYRRASPHNAMLLTERCNSRCVMCSQPPKEADDGHLVDVWLRAIPLMAPSTQVLGITGGEPTLLGDRFLELLCACRMHLPATALHVLSNGRSFHSLSQTRAVAAVEHPALTFGIPLYSDLAWRHDFVVQAEGAFDQTVRGIVNLERCGVRVEVRVVIHRETVGRLPDLARFIARNLPFVEHVALMGLELMGFARPNLEALWVEPVSYQAELRAAVNELRYARMNVSIYNHPLCVLDRRLWPFARRSISDWKNDYLPVCHTCGVKDRCGGFFASSKLRYPSGISPVPSGL